MRRVAIVVLLMTTMMTASKQDETVVGRAIFVSKSDGTLQPIYPVRVRVEREGDGKIVQRAGSLSCEVRARVRDAGRGISVIQTVLRCDDGATYVVTGMIYSGDAR